MQKRRNSIIQAGRACLERDSLPLSLIIIYAAFTYFLLHATGASGAINFRLYFDRSLTLLLILFPTIAVMYGVIHVIHRLDRRRMLAFRKAFSGRRIVEMSTAMLTLAGFMLFLGTFTSMKNALSNWTGGFTYDRTLADLDRMLHFGVDPANVLHVWASNSLVLTLVEWNYSFGWTLICFGALIFVVTSKHAKAVRRCYLMAFMLVWVVAGNIFAGLFISAGPAFYGEVTKDLLRFADLTAFLSQSSSAHSAADFQAYLWNAYEKGATEFGTGISAFPSVHVALISMNAAFLWMYSRKLGLLAFVYVAIIQFSSVYLGWHYAVDGYAGFLIAVAIVFATQRIKFPIRFMAPGSEARKEQYVL